MRLHRLVLVTVCLSVLSVSPLAAAPVTTQSLPAAEISNAVSAIPITFEKNRGQFPQGFDYGSRVFGQSVYIDATGATMVAGQSTIAMSFAGARPAAEGVPGAVAGPIVNYLHGSDQSKWQIGVTSHETVRYDDVYPGIDVEYHSRQGFLEYDFIVEPGADWRNISLVFAGMEPVLTASGDLAFCTEATEVRLLAPVVYQQIGGARREVQARYALRDSKVVFELGAYDPSHELIIDPILDFSRSVIPKLREFIVRAMTRDAAGDLLIAGTNWSGSAPALGITAPTAASMDAIVMKTDAGGKVVKFITYLGGLRRDEATAIAVDPDGNAYITGWAESGDFPTTAGSFAPFVKPGNLVERRRVFVAKLNKISGAPEYSTYIENWNKPTDDSEAWDIAVDAQGQAVIIGDTNPFRRNFPVTPGAFKTNGESFLTKLSANGASLVFSTYLEFEPHAVALDGDGNIYVGGRADTQITTTPGVYEPVKQLDHFTYIAKFTPAGKLAFGTHFPGGSLNDLVLDSNGDIIVTGAVWWESNYPTSPTAFQKTPPGDIDGFVAKLSASGTTLLASTYFGGTLPDSGWQLAIGPGNSIYLRGIARSVDLPMVGAIQPAKYYNPLQFDTVFARFDTSLSQLLFSTYYAPFAFISGPIVDGAGDILFANSGLTFWFKGEQPPFAGNVDNLIVAKIRLAGTRALEVDWMHRSSTSCTIYCTDYEIRFRGNGFQQGLKVKFGDAYSGDVDVYAGGTYVTARLPYVPSPARGVVDVRLENPDSSAVTLTRAFEFGAAEDRPTIRTITPETLDSLGGTVTITATGVPAGGPPIWARHVGFFVNWPLGSNLVWRTPTEATFTLPPVPRDDVNNPMNLLFPTDKGELWGVPDGSPLSIDLVLAPLPTIREIRPQGGTTTGGTSLTILGANFHRMAKVMVGDVFARTVTFIDPFTLLVTTPPNTGGTATVTVINPDNGTGAITDAYTYRGISSISPASGHISGGLTVTITGFGLKTGALVHFGSTPATNVVVSGDGKTITATTPAHASGYTDVTVTSEGEPFVLQGAFRYLEDAPSVTSVSPQSGPDTGGTVVTINGTAFQPGASVAFGGVNATAVSFVSATQLTATTPAHVAGTVNVTVTNPDEQSDTENSAFTFNGISSVSPNKGAPGTSVTLNGAGFQAGATVTVGGVAAQNVVVVNATRITFTVPGMAPGVTSIVVTNPGGGGTFTLTNGFKVLAPPPTITSFSPGTVYPAETVTITGTNFIFVTGVTFSPTAPATSFTVDSDTQITAVVPPAARTGPITVVTESGSATSATDLTVLNAAATITSFDPAGGGAEVTVTITGTRMGGATAVRFGGVPAASFTVTGTTQITAVTPANGITGPICIDTPGPFTGCSATNFISPPRVTSFTPTQGLPGTSVTITGVNLDGATAVSFNNVQAASFTINSATSITAVVPNEATTGLIRVESAYGVGVSASPFGVRPEITSFSPARAGVGHVVTITGLRFTGATAVAFNGAPATFTVVSDTRIDATVPANATDGAITVSTPGGTATSGTPFTIALTPVITAFTPKNGTPGTAVTIQGKNFSGTTSVLFNGSTASFTLGSDTQLTATVPSSATNGQITIVNGEGSGKSTDLFYLPPVLSSFAPNAGTVGSTVEITGNNFIGATAVFLGNLGAAFTVNAQDKITATIPASAVSAPLKVVTPGGSATSTFNYTVLQPTTPTVVATATSPTSVTVSWAGDPTHTYEVRRILRKTDSFTTSALVRVTGNTFVDNTVTAGQTYLYNILDVSTGLIGNHDFATTIMFTDPTLTPGTTIIKRAHLTELRSAVNAMRFAAALAEKTWTDQTPVIIRAVHINELRTALAEAYFSLSRGVNFSDQPVPAGMLMRVSHVTELREAVK